MSTVTKKKEAGRPAGRKHEPNAPKTNTDAASDPIIRQSAALRQNNGNHPTVRVALRAAPPKIIPPGAFVEIDLFGEGIEADYASLLVRRFTDAEYVIDAADHLVSALRDLGRARKENHDRHHVESWSTVINHLHRAEHHLFCSGVDGAASLAVLAGQIVGLLVTAPSQHAKAAGELALELLQATITAGFHVTPETPIDLQIVTHPDNIELQLKDRTEPPPRPL